MNLPFISVITCTYGRTRFLSEAIAMFLAQDYAGESEMVVLNSCPQQKLVCAEPRVKIINLDERPSSLGACRNSAIESAKGEIIVQLDDDDAILPHHLSTFAKHFKDGLCWIWLDTMYFSEKGQIQRAVQGNISTVAYTKDAWRKVGGFSELTVGEDKQFLGKLTASCNGERIAIRPHEISFIYGWANGAPHVSGLGEDAKRGHSSHEWAAKELASRIKEGVEPTGEVVITPKCAVAWVAQARHYITAHHGAVSHKKTAVAIVELGRYGDVANILPVAKHISDSYDKPYFVISKEFASILDGVGYVVPHVVDIPNNEPNKALEIARAEYKFVLSAQIWGHNYPQVRCTPAYNMESWRNCGFLPRFNDKSWKLVFDRRDLEREQKLVNYVTSSGKFKIILVQTTRSISSPFTKGQDILDLIGNSFCDRFRIVDLAGVTAERIYDLIGLMDAAECLVSCDSAPLHLAAASNIPVVALVNPKPWLGTVPRCNCVTRMTYEQVEKNPQAVIAAVEMAVSK